MSRKFLIAASTIVSTFVGGGDLEAIQVAVGGVVAAVYVLAQALVDARDRARAQLPGG